MLVLSLEGDSRSVMPINRDRCDVSAPSHNILFRSSYVCDSAAPAILSAHAGVRVLGEISVSEKKSTEGSDNGNEGGTRVIVAAQEGSLLATVFHPELTSDKRVHEYFVELVREYKKKHTN